MATTTLPGTFGLPYLGETTQILGDPYRFATSHAARYGPVFKTRFLGMKIAILLGAEANRYVLAGNPRNFSARQGYAFVAGMLGDSLLLTDGDRHTHQRRLMAPAFHGEIMQDYLQRLNAIIRSQLDGWGTSGTRTFYPEARKIAFQLSASLFLSLDVGKDYDRLSQLWQVLGEGLNGVIRVDVPTTKYGRGMAAKRALDRLFLDLIAQRRAQPGNDMLSLLIASRDEDGEALTDADLIDQTRLLFFAGYDTTSGTLGWLLVELLQHPDALRDLQAVVAGDPAADVTFADFRDKPLLDAVINETLRLHPQVIATTRGVRETFEFGGYTIPGGWSVMIIPSYSHTRPEYFAEPEMFDPTRFLAPREEDKAHPFAWIGFGGGTHICLGEPIARMEIKALLTHLLRRYDPKLVPGQDLTPLYVPLSRPKGDVPITYTARGSGA